MQNRAQTDALARIAVDVCEDWQLIELDESILGDRVDGALEHLIHEMCHAASLGLSWCQGTSKSVGEVLSRGRQNFLMGPAPPLAIAEETRTWAIEWNVWQFFDLPFEWGDLEIAAEVQGCDGEEIKTLVDHQYISDLADEVYQQLLDFLRGYEKEMQS